MQSFLRRLGEYHAERLLDHEYCRSRDDQARAAGIVMHVHAVLIAVAGIAMRAAQSIDTGVPYIAVIVIMMMMRMRVAAMVVGVDDGFNESRGGSGEPRT